MEKALCYRVVGNKHGTVDKMHTADQAEYGRNAFAKVTILHILVGVVTFYTTIFKHEGNKMDASMGKSYKLKALFFETTDICLEIISTLRIECVPFHNSM